MYTFLHGSHSVHPALLNASFISLLSLLYRILFEEWLVHWWPMMQSLHVQSIKPEKTAYAKFLATNAVMLESYSSEGIHEKYVENRDS